MASSKLVSTADVVLPPKEELKKALQSAEKSTEGADYLLKRATKFVAESKFLNSSPEIRETAKQILGAIEDFVQVVKYKFALQEDIWSGQPPQLSTFKNIQMNISEDAVKKLSSKLEGQQGIRFEFAIKEDGHFVRGYASKDTGKDVPPLDNETVELLDKSFNGWLAQKGIASRDGAFYIIDDQGNESKEPLSEAAVQEIMEDSAKEFKDYWSEQHPGIELITRQRDFPGQTKVADAAKKRAEAAAKALDDNMDQEPTPDTSPGQGTSAGH